MNSKRISLIGALTFAASPAFAASDKPFFSFANSDFIVLIAFIIFIGILVYFKVPGMLMGLLDKRAEGIRAELDEARELREEAQALMASYERKARDAEEQARSMIESAKAEAESQAARAKDEISASVERRLAAAEEQIAQAEASARARVQSEAATMAIAAARSVLGTGLDGTTRARLADEAIESAATRLN